MAVIHLTIDPKYCPSWGFWEGCREIVQNAKDADEFNGNAMSIVHNPKAQKLVITTAEVSLATEALLLLGNSTKRGLGQRGEFGEGFAIGTLALTRAGHPVTIYNGEEVWRPVIETAEDGPFQGQQLFMFRTRKLQQARADFTVEIDNVSKEVWDVTQKLFLFLSPPSERDCVKLSSGTVLLEEDRQGRVFSRGIFVCEVEDLAAGYDLNSLQLDRDRRMVDEWDLRSKLAELWNEAHAAAPDKFAPKLYDMAKRGTPETRNMAWRADQKLLKALHEEFEKENGEGAVPVSDMSESRELAALGAKTIMVDRTLKELLEKTTMPAPMRVEKLKAAVKATFGWNDLDNGEQFRCSEWIDPITKHYAIVEFNDPSVMARPDKDKGVVLLSRTLLAAPDARTIVAQVVRAEAARAGRDAMDVLLDFHFGVPSPGGEATETSAG